MPNFRPALDTDSPGFLAVARGLYGQAFASKSRKALEEAASEWSELTEAERSFATTHLLYLSIEAQAVTQSLLEDVRDALEEIAIVAVTHPDLEPTGSESEDELVEPAPLAVVELSEQVPAVDDEGVPDDAA